MQFAREDYSDALIAEMFPLWEKHYREIAHFKDIPLSPDLDRYKQMALQGFLRIFTVRDNNELVGYQVMAVNFHPHYRSSLQAVQDILFMKRHKRLGMTGYRFIKWCDNQLKDEGVQAVFQHIKADHDFGRLLERMGYQLHDLVYSRRLS